MNKPPASLHRTDNGYMADGRTSSRSASEDSLTIQHIVALRVKTGELTVSEAGLFSLMSTGRRPLTIGELMALTRQSRPTVLHHLRALQRQGIVQVEDSGRQFLYSAARTKQPLGE
jgi:DNA-binding transcriptional ArsR family regulator